VEGACGDEVLDLAGPGVGQPGAALSGLGQPGASRVLDPTEMEC